MKPNSNTQALVMALRALQMEIRAASNARLPVWAASRTYQEDEWGKAMYAADQAAQAALIYAGLRL